MPLRHELYRYQNDPSTFVEKSIDVVIDDGGRALAGFKGSANDCVVRAIAIATDVPYQDVYGVINRLAKSERIGCRKTTISSARTGVHNTTIRKYMASIGWVFTPTMAIGSGCTVHLRACELPEGRIVVSLSKHYTAVIDRVVHDTHDPSRDGRRCVYGIWHHRLDDRARDWFDR